MAKGRHLVKQIFTNFVNSLKPRKYWGDFIGKDYFGTEYYEASTDSHSHKKRRWFVPSKPNNYEQEIPPEWEAWLRYKRKLPPTEEEINLNIQKMLERIENAKNFEKPKIMGSDETVTSAKPKFPTYKDY